MLDEARWLKRAFLPDGLPIQLTFFVTSACQAKCAHCFYGEELNQPLSRELKLDEIERIASGLPRLVWLAFGGGEPFLRRDLVEVADVFLRHNRPKVLTIVTNGLTPDRVEDAARRLLARRDDTFINVSVSLDGLEETHDEVRGVRGNFGKALETLRRLKRLRDENEGLGFSTITTVHSRNAHELEELEALIDSEVRPDNRGLNLIRGTPIDPSTLDVDLAAYRDTVERKRADVTQGKLPLQQFALTRLNAAKDRVLYREVERVARTGLYRAPCRAGRVGAVMYENGDVAACEILDRKIGNIRDFDLDFGALWFSDAAEKLRSDITRHKCRCTWECATSTNVLFGPRYWPELLKEWAGGPDASPRPAPPDRLPRPASVSVLIPCRDEAAIIQRKIQNSLRLRFPDYRSCEILVVDDGSTDDSVELARQEAARWSESSGLPAVRCLSNRFEPGKAGAIRTGFEAASGEIVMLTDTDVLIESEALTRALAPFEDPRTGVVCGEQAYCESLGEDAAAPGDAWNQRAGAIMDPPERRDSFYDKMMRRVRRFESRVDSTCVTHGQMLLFRRDLEIEARSGIASDDMDLCFQARKLGFRTRYAEGARFWEERPRSLAARTRQGKRHGMSIAQVLWVNRDMLLRRKYGLFGLVSLPLQWALMMVQPVLLPVLLTMGVISTLVFAPLWGALLAIGGLAAFALGSKSARSYLFMNGLMLSGLVSLATGRGLTDRWSRDRDADSWPLGGGVA